MATRHERVIVDLDDRFTPGAARMAAGASLFRRELDSADRSVVSFDKTITDNSSSIDKLSGRLGILGRAAAALGPGLVPITTAAVPAIAGLANQLGFAVVGAGTAVLAFNGVGDALEAVNKYQLEPTAENFAKVQDEMRGLGPAAQDLVMYLDEILPRLQRVRQDAQEGVLTGATTGLDQALTRLPEVRRIVREVADTTGDVLAATGTDLASDRWDEFFSFLQSEARPAIMSLSQTVGHLASGMAELWMAMDPLSDDFSAGLLERAAAFEEWASAVDETAGFQEFLAYVRETGPEVLETVGALGNMLLQVGEAAAPLGGPVLNTLEAVADTVAVIADSDLGTPLFAAVGAMSALSLASRGYTAAMGSTALSNVRALTSTKDIKAATDALAVAEEKRAAAAVRARDAQLSLIPTADKRAALNDFVVASERQAQAAEKVAQAEQKRKAAIRGAVADFGRQAAVVGGLALATSGLADSTGLSNAASLALMGTIAGPWGAAIGGSVGLVMDLAGANDSLVDATKAADSAMSSQSVNLLEQQQSLAALQAAQDEYIATMENFGVRGVLTTWGELFTGALDEGIEKSREAFDVQTDLANGLAMVFKDINNVDSLTPQQSSFEELQRFADTIAPAAAAAGIDLRTALLNGQWDQVADAVRGYNHSLDSADGKSRAVGGALAELATEMESNVTQAEALKNSLDALFGVELTQSEATDQAVVALRDMREAVAAAGKALLSNSDAALEARDGIRSYVQAQLDKVNADAAAGVSGDKLVQTLVDTRSNVISAAKAAGLGKQGIAELIKTMGLQPKNLRTIISTPGLLTAKQQVQALGKLYGLTPKQVATLIAQPGMGKSTSQIRALLGQYGLTPRQVKTLISLLGADSAIGKASTLRGVYAGLPRSIVTNIITNHVDKFERMEARAFGGLIGGRSPHKRADNILVAATAGEYMHDVDAVNYYGRGTMDALNQRRIPREALTGYAYGGEIRDAERRATARSYERSFTPARPGAAGAAVVERIVETLPSGPVPLVLANGERLDAYFDHRADGRFNAGRRHDRATGTGRR